MSLLGLIFVSALLGPSLRAKSAATEEKKWNPGGATIWANCRQIIIQKVTRSQEVTSDDIQRVTGVEANPPPSCQKAYFFASLEPLRLFGLRIKPLLS